MTGLVIFAVIVGALSLLAFASVRWGVDSRTMTNDGRPFSLFSR
jgi:hypothetical protein